MSSSRQRPLRVGKPHPASGSGNKNDEQTVKAEEGATGNPVQQEEKPSGSGATPTTQEIPISERRQPIPTYRSSLPGAPQSGIGTEYDISAEEHAAMHRKWGMSIMKKCMTEEEFLLQRTMYIISETPRVLTKAETERQERLHKFMKDWEVSQPRVVPKSRQNPDVTKEESSSSSSSSSSKPPSPEETWAGAKLLRELEAQEAAAAALAAAAAAAAEKPDVTEEATTSEATAFQPEKTLVNFIKLLIARNINLNKTFDNGETLLILAIFEKNVEAVKLLVENGANVSARNSYDQTALMLATQSGVQEIVRVLLEAGAEVDEKSMS